MWCALIKAEPTHLVNVDGDDTGSDPDPNSGDEAAGEHRRRGRRSGTEQGAHDEGESRADKSAAAACAAARTRSAEHSLAAVPPLVASAHLSSPRKKERTVAVGQCAARQRASEGSEEDRADDRSLGRQQVHHRS